LRVSLSDGHQTGEGFELSNCAYASLRSPATAGRLRVALYRLRAKLIFDIDRGQCANSNNVGER